MKKMIMALAAAMMMSVGATAQDNQRPGGRGPRQMDRAEMLKQRTDHMVQEYGLSEEQAQKLLALNTEFADKMPPMMGRGPRGGQRPQAGERQRGGDEQTGTRRRDRREPADTAMRRAPRGQRPQMTREEMEKVMQDYTAGIEKIFTAEQFKKYKEDMEKRRQQGPRGPRDGNRQRPQRQD